MQSCSFPVILRSRNAFSGSADKEVQDERHEGQRQQHDKGAVVSARDFQNLIGHGGDQGTAHNSEGHKCHVCGKMLHTEKGRSECGGDGGAGAIGDTRQAQSRDAQRQ